MQDNAAPLVGLMFYFNGKDPAMYGKQGATEVSFIIDGSGGERIVEVLYERATTSLGIWSLSVRRPHPAYQKLQPKLTWIHEL